MLLLTRDLNKRIPKDQNILNQFGNLGIANLESMGLPAHGDIIVSNNGVPSIRTEFGTFPLSDTSLMSIEERINLLPIVRQFTDILERGSADPVETELLLEKAHSLTRFIPENIKEQIQTIGFQIDGAARNFA